MMSLCRINVIITLAVLTFATAIVAAVYWFKSAAVPMPQLEEPIASISDAPEQHIMTAGANSGILVRALTRSSGLNKRAAIWTGISALLGAATTVCSALA